MKKNKIAILLPFKDNFTNSKAGSASIWIKDFNKNSSYKENLYILGYTDNQSDLIEKKRYINLDFKETRFKSKNLSYLDEFISVNIKQKFSLVEIHNRPSYVKHLLDKNIPIKIVLIFHNNPITLGGSKNIQERKMLIEKCEKLIFVSHWVKDKFFEGLDINNHNKCIVIHPSVNKINKLPPKEKIISFVGKLNESKGFHIFGNVIVKILNKYKNWRSIVIGDEPREKYNFKHKNLEYKGWISHKETLKIYDKTSISIVPSIWDEPFGRTAMEAASRGCATIVSKKGGLTETTPAGIYLQTLNFKNLYNQLEKLIKDNFNRKRIQIKSYQHIFHNLNENTSRIDKYRDLIFGLNNFNIIKKKSLKIIHISNFGNRLFNRLYFLSIAKKISNGLIRNGHDVINISDRDTIRFNRIVAGKTGIEYLNKLFVESVKNYSPDLIILGHSDNILKKTFEEIKKFKSEIKIAQWFEDNLHNSGPDPVLNKKKLFQYNPYIDHSFITTHPSALPFLSNQSNYHYLPIPVDKNIENLNIYNENNQIYDLFFTMSHGVNRGKLKKNKSDIRYPFIKKMIDKNPNIIFDIYGYENREPIWSEDFYKTIRRSKMALNLSRTNMVKYYTSNRISSLIGNGLMTFIDVKTKLNDFFDDNEVIFYNNLNELSQKLNLYKENSVDRKNIARRGQKKYFDYFDTEVITQYIIDTIYNNKYKNFKKWMDG